MAQPPRKMTLWGGEGETDAEYLERINRIAYKGFGIKNRYTLKDVQD